MVFRKSGGGSAVKNMQGKGKGGNKAFKQSLKQDPFDAMDSDSGEETLQKTPMNKGTPKGRQSLTGKKQVSFQIPGKLTPAKTPNKQGSAVKHVPTPGSKKKTVVPEFKGIKGGKNQPKKQAAEDCDDDDDEDDEDDEELDLDLDLGDDDSDDLDLDDDDEDEDDSDEDDDDDDDDEDDDEDDDDDDDDEEEKMIVAKGNKQQIALKKNQASEIAKQKTPVKPEQKKVAETPKAKNAVATKNSLKRKAEDDDDEDEDDDDDEEDEDEDEDSEEEMEITKNGTAKKTPIQAEKKTVESPKKKANQNKLAAETQQELSQRKKEMDALKLWVGALPPDITVDELKALSPDVVNVIIPLAHKKNMKSRYAFLVFKTEKKAEENIKILKTKKIRGQLVTIDYVGEKSSNKKVSEENNLEQRSFNKRKLHVSGLPLDSTIDQIAKLFPQAFQISTNKANTEYRTAMVNFLTDEEAAEAFKSNQKCEISGQKILVLYSAQGKPPKKHKRSVNHQHKGTPFKKQKV